MHVDAIDHLVLTVHDEAASIAFYTRVLGMREIDFGDARKALGFGASKLNLHRAGEEHAPHAAHPRPGAIDLCLLTQTPLETWLTHLDAHQVAVIEGPVERTGARGALRSIYLRDPDGNLIELSNPL